jgi:hypothetical protein
MARNISSNLLAASIDPLSSYIGGEKSLILPHPRQAVETKSK